MKHAYHPLKAPSIKGAADSAPPTSLCRSTNQQPTKKPLHLLPTSKCHSHKQTGTREHEPLQVMPPHTHDRTRKPGPSLHWQPSHVLGISSLAHDCHFGLGAAPLLP
uniref:Uncharacterized protein n=1 Tax=Arundo donax TaxID=35708 RepID=A0A0A9D4K3_ARUDO